MKRFIFPVLLLLLFVGVAVAQDVIPVDPNAVAQAVNTTGVIAAVILGAISVPVTNFFKEKLPFIQGWVTPLLNGAVNLVALYLLNWTLGWGVWDNPTFFQQVVVALGIPVSVAQIVFEATKKKTA